MAKFQLLDHAWLVENGGFTVSEVVIESIRYDRYTISFVNKSGMIRVPESRLFKSEEEARASIRRP